MKKQRILILLIIASLTLTIMGCGKKTRNKKYINEAIESLCMPTEVFTKIDLPTEHRGIEIIWETNEPLVMTPQGEIYAYEEPKQVELTGTFNYNGTTLVQKFPITVDASDMLDKFNAAWNTYNEYIESSTLLDMKLPTQSYNLCTVSYATSDESIMTPAGVVTQKIEDQKVTLYCYLYRDGVYAIYSKEITVLGYTEQQKIDMIRPYVDEQVELFKKGEISKLPHTHPLFGGVIYWHSLEEGFVSYEGHVVKPLTPRDINMTATIRFNERFLERYYTLENYGGNTTLEENLQSWLKFILPTEILGTYNVTHPDNDSLISSIRTQSNGVLNLFDASDISKTFNKEYYIDEKGDDILTQCYGSSTFGLYHPDVPQEVLDGYFYEGYKMPNEQNILWITVHESGMPRENQGAELLAQMQWRYTHQADGRSASWHYQVDATGIYQSYNDNLICWHASDGSRIAGNGNCNSIGIEMCINKDDNYEAAMRNDAKLIAYLMHKYNLKLENIKRHYDFAPDKKVCPNYMIVTGRWLEFLDLINIEYMALEYLQNATITWSVTTKDNDNTENVLNQYFTYASNNLWIAKPVHEPVELTIKVKVEKDGKTYEESSILVLNPEKKEEE